MVEIVALDILLLGLVCESESCIYSPTFGLPFRWHPMIP